MRKLCYYFTLSSSFLVVFIYLLFIYLLYFGVRLFLFGRMTGVGLWLVTDLLLILNLRSQEGKWKLRNKKVDLNGMQIFEQVEDVEVWRKTIFRWFWVGYTSNVI